MNKKIMLLAAALMGLTGSGIAVSAQDEDQNTLFGTRYSAEIDKRITRGLHVYAGEELRLDNSFSMDRLYTSAGISYKVNDYLKVAAGYSAILVQKEKTDGNVLEWRHRATADVTGSYRTGSWKFSVRERFQATYMAKDVNTFEKPRTSLALKSRAKVSYGIPGSHVEPFAAFEHRLALNGAKWDEFSTDADRFRNSKYIGNEDVFTSRLRGQLGAKWKIDRKNAIEVYGLFDRVTEKEIDSKRASAVLKEPVTTTDSNRISIGIGYSFSF